MRSLIITIVVALGLFLNLAYADQNDDRLNSLFDQLFLSSNDMKANIILADIWNIWYIAKNQDVQIIFDEANQQMDRRNFDSAINLVFIVDFF